MSNEPFDGRKSLIVNRFRVDFFFYRQTDHWHFFLNRTKFKRLLLLSLSDLEIIYNEPFEGTSSRLWTDSQKENNVLNFDHLEKNGNEPFDSRKSRLWTDSQ